MNTAAVIRSVLSGVALAAAVASSASAFDRESGPAGAEGVSTVHMPDSAYTRPGYDWDLPIRETRKDRDGPGEDGALRPEEPARARDQPEGVWDLGGSRAPDNH